MSRYRKEFRSSIIKMYRQVPKPIFAVDRMTPKARSKALTDSSIRPEKFKKVVIAKLNLSSSSSDSEYELKSYKKPTVLKSQVTIQLRIPSLYAALEHNRKRVRTFKITSKNYCEDVMKEEINAEKHSHIKNETKLDHPDQKKVRENEERQILVSKRRRLALGRCMLIGRSIEQELFLRQAVKELRKSRTSEFARVRKRDKKKAVIIQLLKPGGRHGR